MSVKEIAILDYKIISTYTSLKHYAKDCMMVVPYEGEEYIVTNVLDYLWVKTSLETVFVVDYNDSGVSTENHPGMLNEELIYCKMVTKNRVYPHRIQEWTSFLIDNDLLV